MELGNMLFGNSRGDFPIERHTGFETELTRLFDSYDQTGNRGYSPKFENDTFSVFPYYWGECDCGEEHSPDCPVMKPNFLFKPTGFAIEWYKYPLRDSYSNQKITLREFVTIIDACIESLKEK